MDGSSSVMGKPKTENYHIYKFFGLQQSGSIDDNCETMEEYTEEDIWGGVNAEAKQVALQENGWYGVAECRSMGIMEENSNNSRRTVKILRKESCYQENNEMRLRSQSSAPVNIPDWSQMVWKEKKNTHHWGRSHGIVDDKSDGAEMDFERIPPHDLIASQLAQRDIYSFSLYEGIGRTLKGRDLCRVRNAVLMRTGFLK